MDYQEEYIKKNPNLHLEHSAMKINQLLKVLPNTSPRQSILDVGCGAGAITIAFAEKFKPRYVEGIDVSEAIIDQARKSDNKNLVVWRVSDIFNYTAAKSFDLVICADIMEHLEDDINFLKKIGNLGKEILVRVPVEDSYFSRFLEYVKIFDAYEDTRLRYGHLHYYNGETLSELFEISGLTITKSISLPMPKRSRFIFEIFRILFYPLSLISMDFMVKIAGGFKVYRLKNEKL